MPLKDPVKRKKYHDNYSKNWYQQRADKHKQLQYETRNKRRQANFEYIKSQKNKPCKDCKISYPFYVMHFDHLPEHQKLSSLSGMRSWSLQKIKDEIAKCELVCSNCHAKRTYQRRIMEVQLRSKE